MTHSSVCLLEYPRGTGSIALSPTWPADLSRLGSIERGQWPPVSGQRETQWECILANTWPRRRRLAQSLSKQQCSSSHSMIDYMAKTSVTRRVLSPAMAQSFTHSLARSHDYSYGIFAKDGRRRRRDGSDVASSKVNRFGGQTWWRVNCCCSILGPADYSVLNPRLTLIDYAKK